MRGKHINELLSLPSSRNEMDNDISWSIYVFECARIELNAQRNNPAKYRKALKHYKVAAMNLAKCTAANF